MILAFFKYCYFWIDILGFLTQTFKPAPPPRMFSYGVPPWGFTIWKQWGRLQNKGLLFAELDHTHQSNFGIAYIVWKFEYGVNQIAVIKLTRVGPPSALSRKFSGSEKRYWDILDLVWDPPTQTRNTPQPNIATQVGRGGSSPKFDRLLW